MGQLAPRCETSRSPAIGLRQATILNAPAPTMACISVIICSTLSGLPKKRLPAGLSASMASLDRKPG